MFNHKKFNIPKLNVESLKIDYNLQKKKPSEIVIKSIDESFNISQIVYETDWAIATLTKIPEATSTTIEELLPEKADFSYSFQLNIPEKYLPFLKFDVLAKTIPDQDIQGVKKFNYTSLEEVGLKIYNFPAHWIGGIGPVNANNPPDVPPPSFLYHQDLEYFDIGGVPWVRWVYYFIPRSQNFPVPDGDVLPGGLTDWSNEEYSPAQWVGGTPKTFQELIVLIGQDEARDSLTEWYPDIIMTPEVDGPPWKSYRAVSTKKVEIATKQVIINKLGEDNFNITVKGYFLLLSKAITETTWSDPLYPTYEPQGQDLHICLKVFFKNLLRTNNYQGYIK